MSGHPGILVVSLDFELHWGIRDHSKLGDPYTSNLLGVRSVVPALLELFSEFGIGATWATVGMLFASTRAEWERFKPLVLPSYRDPRLDPYRERLGKDEREDPFHFAPSLIERIRATPRQEIATHTFSHFFQDEPGATREAFEADLRSAIAIAREHGVEVRSLVFPRNQRNPQWDEVIREKGIRCFRGNRPAWLYRSGNKPGDYRLVKAIRFADAHLPLSGNGSFVFDRGFLLPGLVNVRESAFLRPAEIFHGLGQALRIQRLKCGIRAAARTGGVFHLWWHPHQFGGRLTENLAQLRSVFEEFSRQRSARGMLSMTMLEASQEAISRVRGEEGMLGTPSL